MRAVKRVAAAGLLRWIHHTVQVYLVKGKQANLCAAALSPVHSKGVACV